MRPLFFLTWRTFVNAVRRAIKSPRRVIGVLVMASYWLLIVGRFGFSSSRSRISPGSELNFEIQPELVYAIIFSFFFLLLIFRLFGVFAMPYIARPQDADILFPTPISPRAVLGHRLLFAYASQLLLPLIILAFAGVRGGSKFASALANFSAEQMAQFRWTLPIAYLAMSALLIAIHYAVGLSINQDNSASRARLKLASIAMYLLLGSVTGIIVWVIVGTDPWQRAMQALNHPALKILAFPASGPTSFAVAPLTGNWTLAWALILSCTVITGGLLWSAFRQAHTAYDLAARRLAGEITSIGAGQRPHAGEATVLQQIRGGKKKPWRIRWLDKARPSGAGAVFWCQLVCSLRTSFGLAMFSFLIAIAVSITPLFVKGDMGRVGVLIVVGMLLLSAHNMSMMVGFEAASRLDLKRSLPIKPIALLAAQATGALVPIIVPGVFVLVAFSAFLSNAVYLLAAPLLVFSALSSAFAQTLTSLFFPDHTDPTQAGLRTLVMMLSLAIILAPPIGIFAIGVLTGHPFYAALGAIAYSAAASVGCLFAATRAYEKFSPSET